MVEIEQVVRWLKESGEEEAARIAKLCSLNWTWVTLGSELAGDRDYDMWDVSIEAPAQVLKAVRGSQTSLPATIEESIRDLCDATETDIIRSIRWVPKVPPVARESEQAITEVTRRAIADILSGRNWSGRLSETEFLSRLYDLDTLPSQDPRYKNAADDIWQHRVNNDDGEPDWVFYDNRFGLLIGADRELLRFLCETVHPVVRPDTPQALDLVNLYNHELRADGWELTPAGEISGRPVFQAKKSAQSIELFDDPTGWPKVDRQLGELQLRLRDAVNEEHFQAVGHLCRETLISVAQVVYDRERHPTIDGVEPSKTDAKRMLDAFVSVELAGSESAAVRKAAKAAFDLSNELQHKRTATFKEAALSAEATFSTVRLIAIISGRRER